MELLAQTTTGEVIVKLSLGQYVEMRNREGGGVNSNQKYGARVRMARVEMKLTQLDLSTMLGISRNYLSQIERGKAKNISHKIVQDIQFHCGVI